MSAQDLQLIEPCIAYMEDFMAMALEYIELGTPYEKSLYHEAIGDFGAYLRRLEDYKIGQNLPSGWVANTTYWLVRDGQRIVANSNLRHTLNESLLYEGGHIGYGTRPSERRKGYGMIVCAKTLQAASAIGMRRVLITCDSDNFASARIIEENGGAQENEVISRFTGKVKKRYWVQF